MDFVFNIVLCVLLLVTIALSIYLTRALTRLRRDREELTTLIDKLNLSSSQAHNGIDHLRNTADLVGRQLGKSVEQARSLRVELAELIERGDRSATRLEQGMAVTRFAAHAEPAPAPVMRAVAAPSPLPLGGDGLGRMTGKSAAERDLLRALRLKQG